MAYFAKAAKYAFIQSHRHVWPISMLCRDAGLIFHSDRGSPYASQDFHSVLTAYGMTASMSRKGDCWDNACSESLFGSLKMERLLGQQFKRRRRRRMKSWPGYSGTTGPDCTRHLSMSARCSTKKTGSPSNTGKPVRRPAIGYGIQGQGQLEFMKRKQPLRF